MADLQSFLTDLHSGDSLPATFAAFPDWLEENNHDATLVREKIASAFDILKWQLLNQYGLYPCSVCTGVLRTRDCLPCDSKRIVEHNDAFNPYNAVLLIAAEEELRTYEYGLVSSDKIFPLPISEIKKTGKSKLSIKIGPWWSSDDVIVDKMYVANQEGAILAICAFGRSVETFRGDHYCFNVIP